MKKLFTLFIALVAGMGALQAAVINVTDNSIADWNSLPDEYVAQAVCPQSARYTGLNYVKVYAEGEYIYILVEPNMNDITNLELVPFHIFIDTDNSDATGGYSDIFADANSDIMFEGALFSYDKPCSYEPAVWRWYGELGGAGWEWIDPNVEHSESDCWGAILCYEQLVDCYSQYVNGVFEIQINRSNIPVAWNQNVFRIGFEIEQNWNAVGFLPHVEPTDSNPYGKTNKLSVTINSPVEANVQQVGDFSYALNDANNTAIVVAPQEGESGYMDLITANIPDSITYQDKQYNVTGIDRYAFAACTNLTSVTIPDGVTIIGENAFYNCSGLKNVILGSSVYILAKEALSGCYAIDTITCYSQRPPTVNSNALYGINYSTIVYVPKDYLNAYKAHNVWRLYNVCPIKDPNEPEIVAGTYRVHYTDKNSDEIYQEDIILHIPVAPEIEGFSFLYWRPVATNIAYGLIIEAVYEADEPFDVPEVVVNPANPSQKLIRNGNVYILRDGKTYTMTGQQIQ